MKKGPFKMKSPLLKDVKIWKWDGSQVIIDDSTLSNPSMDDFGNKTIEYNYTDKEGKKATEILYKNKPRKGSILEDTPIVPTSRPIEDKTYIA